MGFENRKSGLTPAKHPKTNQPNTGFENRKSGLTPAKHPTQAIFCQNYRTNLESYRHMGLRHDPFGYDHEDILQGRVPFGK